MRQLFFRMMMVSCMMLLTAVAQAQKTPLEMNDRLVSVIDSVAQLGQAWADDVNDALKTRDFSIIKPARIKLEKYIAKELISVKLLKDVKNSKELRQMVITLLEYEKKAIANGMVPIEMLNTTSSDEDLMAKMENFKTVTADESKLFESIGAAQEAYARSNNFSIEGTESAQGNEEQ